MITEPPGTIYLQFYGEEKPVTDADWENFKVDVEDVTWCPHRALDPDVKYVRADLLPSAGLSFRALREANLARVHDDNRVSNNSRDWSLAQWMNATLGELGEAANILKKVDRGDFTLDEARDALGKEIADTLTYLDIFAAEAGLDLGQAVEDKFNEISHRIGASVFLENGHAIHRARKNRKGAA